MNEFCFDAYTFLTSIDYFPHSIIIHLFYRSIQVVIVSCQNSLNLPEDKSLFHLSQWSQSTFSHRQIAVRDNLILVYQTHHTQSFAMRTGTLRRVERKIVRSRFVVT